MTPVPRRNNEADSLVEVAVQLELARIELVALTSALRARLAQRPSATVSEWPLSGSPALAPSQVSPSGAAPCTSLLGLDAWWRISADLRIPGTTLEAEIRRAISDAFPAVQAATLRAATAAMDDSQRRDIRSTAHSLRKVTDDIECPDSSLGSVVFTLEEAAKDSDPQVRCARLHSTLTQLRAHGLSA